MRHILAILWKQVKDTFKNKTILDIVGEKTL